MALPRILVGCPTAMQKNYCLTEYVTGVKRMTYPNMDVLLVDNSPSKGYAKKIEKKGLPVKKMPFKENVIENLAYCRNVLRDKVIDENYEYLFSLEQDIVTPPDILEYLLKYKLPIISALYWNVQTIYGKKQFCPLLRVYDKNNPDGEPMRLGFDRKEDANLPKGLLDAAMIGLGCVLIHRDVLEKIKFRVEPGSEFDDYFFSRDARKQGYHLFVDTAVEVFHRYQIQVWNYDSNEQLQNKT